MKPLISVIVPVYQVEKYIENTIISICKQTIKTFEVILINDGTRDNSIEIAETILKDFKIDYKTINQNNKGLSAARNIGVKNASGDWIICIDSDDVIYSRNLEILYDSCVKFKTNVAIGNFQYVDERTLFKLPFRICDSVIMEREELLRRFLVRDINIVVPAILLNKEFLLKNGLFYDESIKFSEDQHYVWRILLISDKVAYNNTFIYNYLLRPNSIMTSSTIEKILTGYEGFVKLTSNLMKDLSEKTMSNQIMSRWVLGVLHSSAKMLNYNDYKDLAYRINSKQHLANLYFVKDIRISCLIIILNINFYMFYLINRKF